MRVLRLGQLETARERHQRAVSIMAVVAALAACVLGWATSGVALSPTDAYVYFLAGERLNAGHELYALRAGDVIVAPNPPYWTVPFLSPPLLGVLWRPLAALGSAGLLLGWAFTAVALLITVALFAFARPVIGVGAAVTLAVPLGLQLGLGNVNGLVIAGLAATWQFRDRPYIAGTLVALLASVKVVPVLVLVWLAATKRWRAVLSCVLAGFALLALALAGSSATQVVQYVGIMATTTADGSTALSSAGVLRELGATPVVARAVPWAIAAGGSAIVVAIGRRHPRLSFGLTVILMLAASPVVYPYWFALLIAALFPLVSRSVPWNARGRAVHPAA